MKASRAAKETSATDLQANVESRTESLDNLRKEQIANEFQAALPRLGAAADLASVSEILWGARRP